MDSRYEGRRRRQPARLSARVICSRARIYSLARARVCVYYTARYTFVTLKYRSAPLQGQRNIISVNARCDVNGSVSRARASLLARIAIFAATFTPPAPSAMFNEACSALFARVFPPPCRECAANKEKNSRKRARHTTDDDNFRRPAGGGGDAASSARRRLFSSRNAFARDGRNKYSAARRKLRHQLDSIYNTNAVHLIRSWRHARSLRIDERAKKDITQCHV